MTTSDHSIGHSLLDAHHEAMLAHIEELARQVEAEDAASAATTLAALWDDTVGHFATEDAFMEEHGYPESAAHRRAHHLFLEDLRELIRELHEHGVSNEVAAWAQQRLPEWVKFHIEANDAPLAQFIVRRTAARIVAAAQGEELEKPKRTGA